MHGKGKGVRFIAHSLGDSKNTVKAYLAGFFISIGWSGPSAIRRPGARTSAIFFVA